jgi:imidazolonepropionase-like amidohydrolase
MTAQARPSVRTIALALLLLAEGTASAQETLAVVGGVLIDGTGRPSIVDSVILVREGRIAAAGSREKISIPPEARRLEASDRFIIPGLMDANVHLVLGTSIEYVVRHEGRYEEVIEEAAQIALKNGLTTVFDSWGPTQPLLDVRDRIARGEIEGSRLFVAGNIVGFSGPFGRDFNSRAEGTATKALVERINAVWEENVGPDLLWMSPEGVREEVRKYIARGIDFLKYGASAHNNIDLQFSPETGRVIVSECRRAGITCQTHTTNVMSLKHAIDTENDLLQHPDVTGPVAIPDATIARLAERQIPCAILPRTRERLKFELTRGAEQRAPQLLEIMHFNQIRLLQGGARLLLSTDAGVMDPDNAAQQKPEELRDRSTTLGDAHFLWFKAMQENGMRPMDAILAATRNIAAAYRKLDDFGTIEPGKRADLVILGGDPLDDLNNIRKIEVVIKDGSIVDRAALPRRPALTAPREASKPTTTVAPTGSSVPQQAKNLPPDTRR